MKRKLITTLIFVNILGASFPALSQEDQVVGSVHILSNDLENNSVVSFNRLVDGRLTFRSEIETGGQGGTLGVPINALGSQGSIIFSDNNRWVFAVNAGSNSFSVFRNQDNGLQLIGTHDSGGQFPISIDIENDILYVLNTGSVVGFEFNDDNGAINPIEGAVIDLSEFGTRSSSFLHSPGQVEFSPGGNWLAMTNKGLNEIVLIPIDRDGNPGIPVVNDSAGNLPFGFSFTRDNHLVVAEVFGRDGNQGAISTYSVNDIGQLSVIERSRASLTAGQGATSRVELDPRNDNVYATNNFSSNNSNSFISHQYNLDGTLTYHGDQATGANPAELGFTNNGRFLYILNAGEGSISGYRVPEESEIESFVSNPNTGNLLFSEWQFSFDIDFFFARNHVFTGSVGLSSNPLDPIGKFGQGFIPVANVAGIAIE